ncbi:MAG: thiolase domain-containing protein [Anaerolineales bacterium]|nr:thiolase domain-containing protein [Anaerolineales bacterium]
MTDVVIAGIGQTPVSELWGKSLRELALEAIVAAALDAGGLQPQALFVGNMLAPQLSHQAHLGALLADFAGLTGIEAATLEAAGASGGAALRAGFMAVASGQVDVALVVGVEKFSDQVGAPVEAAIATASDSDFEAVQGLTPTAQAALLMRRYLHEYNLPREIFAGFPLIAHANGAGNPNAMFRKAISAEAYHTAGLVSDPLNMFDVAPNADGASALILTRPELLPPQFPHRLVRVAGSSMVSDRLALHDRANPMDFQAVRQSVQRACEKAHISPLQIDLFELYDAYSIYAVLTLEAAGFAGRGQGWQLAVNQDGVSAISLNGSLPISTLGGLKARGNPGGATGVYQCVEAVLQLRGQAGKNQVPDAHRAMIQCLGGPASTAITHILEAGDS